ncbi:MAG: acyl carrier protein [Solirubrobacteraceae bacterium]
MSVPAITWQQFAEAIAEIACVPADQVGPDTRLIADLNIDSLALVEIFAVLVTDFGMDTLAAELDDRRWEILTLGELYEEHRTGQRVKPAVEFDIQLPRY